MENKLTLQTQGAFDRIHDAILGKTNDDLKVIIEELKKHLSHCYEVDNMLEEVNYLAN